MDMFVNFLHLGALMFPSSLYFIISLTILSIALIAIGNVWREYGIGLVSIIVVGFPIIFFLLGYLSSKESLMDQYEFEIHNKEEMKNILSVYVKTESREERGVGESLKKVYKSKERTAQNAIERRIEFIELLNEAYKRQREQG